jgi:hypothetical protein
MKYNLQQFRQLLIRLLSGFHEIYFLANVKEGILEKETYLKHERRNLSILKRCFRENAIKTNQKKSIISLSDCIYGSLGSSSSQIFFPKNGMDVYRCIKQDLKSRFHDTVNVVEDGDWVIVLIPANRLNDYYIPFQILYRLYQNSGLPIAISNAISNRIYGKSQTYSDLDSPDAKLSASLGEIIRTRRIKPDEKNRVVIRALDNMYSRDSNPSVRDFLHNTIVIPRLDNRNHVRYKNIHERLTNIENGWIKHVNADWIKHVNADWIKHVKKHVKAVDIGGSITNQYLNKYFNDHDKSQADKMVSAIRQVTKGKTPILTGEIRALVEREFNRLRDILSLDKESGIYSFKSSLVTRVERKSRKCRKCNTRQKNSLKK